MAADLDARDVLKAEAKLLESHAQNMLGYPSRPTSPRRMRASSSGPPATVASAFALADYYDGSAASFAKDYIAGERLLRRALRVFAEFGPDDLMARADALLGILYYMRGEARGTLSFLDCRPSRSFDPVEDARVLGGDVQRSRDRTLGASLALRGGEGRGSRGHWAWLG